VILPGNIFERQLFYEELVRQCTASRMDRFNFYQVLRNYYLFGSSDSKGAPYNKIKSTVKTLMSFLYSPDTMRFSLHLGTEASTDDVHKAVPLAKEVSEQWRVTKAHIAFGLGARWAHIYGIMLMKTLWNRGIRGYLVEPHQFGVLREDIMNLEDQEAFTHHYTMTKTELDSRLRGNPRRQQIMTRVGRNMVDQLPPLATGLQRLIVGSPVGGVPGSQAIPGSGNMVEGGMGGRGPIYDYAPKVDAELLDMCDLYVWDDENDDYQVVTRAAPDVIIFDRPSSWLGHVKGMPPFTVIRPEFDLYDYFWGSAFIADLTWMQDWRTERTLDVRQTLRKQFDPPMSITGGVGIAEEKLLALRVPGGRVSFPTPNAKVTPHAPTMPSDTFAEISEIDQMFDDTAGLGHVLQGKGEHGVRSRGQADLMARLGSARPKDRAVALEESAEALARNMLRLIQDHSEQRFIANVGGHELPFTAEQFTRDYEVKVDGHSSSPIFVEDRKHDAITLREQGAIDLETLLDMFDPPNLQDLKERLKKMEQARAQEKQAELEAMRQGQGATHARPNGHGRVHA
jgi:hypothetical protein